MRLDIASVTTYRLPQPTGVAYEFTEHLAIYADCAFSFFCKNDMREEAKEFCKDDKLNKKKSIEIDQWINGLPWNENDEMVLHFSLAAEEI